MSLKVASIILAAGASIRFGKNKFLAKIHDKLLIERTLEPFLEHQDLQNDIIVVTGHYTDELKPFLTKYEIKQIHNPLFNNGMSSSIKAGMKILQDQMNNYSGILVHPGDIPFVTSQDLERLLSCHKSTPNMIIIPKFNGKRGHPIIIPNKMFSGLETIGEDTNGLRGLIRASVSFIKYVNVNNQGILEDIDTKIELDELSKLLK